MATFWVISTLLAILALAIVLVPLYRRGQLTPTIVGSASVVPIVAAIIYTQLSSWSWDVEPAAANDAQQVPGPVAEMVTGLQERLVRDPEDVDGWKLLARSYVVLGRYPEARAAIEEVWKRTPEPDNELTLAYVEAHALADRASLRGQPGVLVEAVLEKEPDNPRALWYGGMSAIVNNRQPDAIDRWTRLLQLNPPEDVANVLREQLTALGADTTRLAASGNETPSAVSGIDMEAIAINLRVSLSEQAEPEAAALFVIARDPAGGPPVAVARHGPGALPGDFVLSDENAMLAGRSLKDFEELEVVARLSKSGEPIAQAGDWFGQGRYRPGDGILNIVINQQVE